MSPSHWLAGLGSDHRDRTARPGNAGWESGQITVIGPEPDPKRPSFPEEVLEDMADPDAPSNVNEGHDLGQTRS